jgi:hypothetical protein
MGPGELLLARLSFIGLNKSAFMNPPLPRMNFFSDGQKRTMLENVVSSHNELRMIKTQADQLKPLNGSVLIYT